jgi:transposase
MRARTPRADQTTEGDRVAAVSCGIDGADDHHDVAFVDEQGSVVAAERVEHSATGLARVLELLAAHDPADGRLEVAIETSKGLLVAGLRAAGRVVSVINPLAVSRYRDRYRSSRGKSDAFDAMVLANILRTDCEAHRSLPADRPEVQALRALTRAQQDAVEDRTALTNRVRALLKESSPPRWPPLNAAGITGWTPRVPARSSASRRPDRGSGADPAPAGRVVRQGRPATRRRGRGRTAA